MSDIDELRQRIDRAKHRLGLADESQLKQIEDLNARVKAIKERLSSRHFEIAQHQEQVSRLRHENEQLRGMLHKLLLAIEERSGGPIREILRDLEGQVTSLVALAGMDSAPEQSGPQPPPGNGPADPPTAEGPAEVQVKKGETAEAGQPDEGDSRWLQRIMERARELTADRAGPQPGLAAN